MWWQERWDRGRGFGELLNHGDDEALATLALAEIVCAPLVQLRALVPSVPADNGGPEPLMVLVETDGVPARVRLLEGKLPAVGPSKMLTFAFDDLGRLAEAKPNAPKPRLVQEGVGCAISRVVLDKDRWTVQVALDYPPGGKQLDSYQSWVVNNEMVLESKDGKRRLTSNNYVVENSSPRRAVVSYHFRDTDKGRRGRPDEWKLLYRTPASIIEMPIAFRFKDVPLP